MSAVLILDCETSGLSPQNAGIVEVAAVAVIDGEVAGSWVSLTWPGYEHLSRPEHWAVLTNVSRIYAGLLLDAPDVSEAAWELRRWATGILGELPLSATSFNVGFDRAFIAAHAAPLQERLAWQDCLMERARRALSLPRWPSLATACEALGVEQSGEHRALADAMSAAKLWLALEGKR